MLQSILAVDSLAIQRSLTILEDRYRELREIGEKRFEAWEKEKGDLQEQLRAQGETLQQVQTARDELMQQKQEAIEEVELTLLQLHQVQEELEHYFLNAQSAEQLATAQQDQLLRAQALMARVLPEAVAQPLVQGLEVEVLPPLTPAAGVQTEALLSSYASSLHRAASLLQRAMQR